MPHLPSRTPRQIIRLLEEKGFVRDHVTGSHYIYRDPTGKRVTVPYHARTLPRGTLLMILKQAGIGRNTL